MTRMPYGWVAEKGDLDTDIIEDTSVYNTGGRSLKLVGPGPSTIISQPIPVGVDSSSEDSVRRVLGWTLNFAWSDPIGSPPTSLVNTDAGFYFYDINGDYISKDSRNIRAFSGSSAFETDGDMSDVPSSPSVAQFARFFVSLDGGAADLTVDHVIPYVVPPFGLASFSGTRALTVGAHTIILLTYTPTANRWRGGHCIRNSLASSGRITVRETGLYTVTASVSLDNFVATDDSFRLVFYSLDTYGFFRYYYGQIFAPAVSFSGMNFNPFSNLTSLSHTQTMPMTAGTDFRLEVAQLSGTPRNVTDAQVYFSKES